jgi:hypothetical protein
MERRIRLVWSPEHLRSWCQGASLPPAKERASSQAATGFVRMQRLMEKIRQRRASGVELEPPAPLPQPRLPDGAPSACDADQLSKARDAAH